jgi:hypothetical protein
VTKEQRVRKAAEHDSCPQCGKSLTDRVGSGRLSDGVFCSLNCMALFHDDYYRERISHATPSAN